MGYIQENLMSNEKILYSARVHLAVFLPSIFSIIFSLLIAIYGFSIASNNNYGSSLVAGMVILLAFGFFFYSVLLGLQALIIMLTTEFSATNQRIIAKTGFIRRHTLEILLSKIESVSVKQGILGRLINFGTVTITGTGGTSESFRAIIEPTTVRKKINQIIEHYS